MKEYTVFDSTGRVLRAGLCAPGDLPLQARSGEFVLEGQANDVLHYVVDGAVMPRPVMPIMFDNATVPADGASTVTFTGVPAGANARVSGPAIDAFTVPDGVVVMTFDAPGAYVVGIEKFPYRDFEVVINAT